MRELQVDMDEILDALESGENDPVDFLLDLETGKVETRFRNDLLDDIGEEEGELDSPWLEHPERYEEIPKISSHEEYSWMCEFADSIDESDIRQMLDLALQGKGAFARFRDVVFRYPDLKTRWFAMKREALLKEALLWFESLEIEPIYELHPIEPESTVSGRGGMGGTARISLLDILLLGAPEGKSELLDGKVLRQIDARTPPAAREIFKHLARELCEYYGIAWRKRFVQDHSTLDLERTHLEVDGTIVRLWVDVPLSTWKAFL
jgi:hypothetical protein